MLFIKHIIDSSFKPPTQPYYSMIVNIVFIRLLKIKKTVDRYIYWLQNSLISGGFAFLKVSVLFLYIFKGGGGYRYIHIENILERQRIFNISFLSVRSDCEIL